ncbi:MAG: hypothetical protein ACE5FU_12235 [Nitrospinota bacterium]
MMYLNILEKKPLVFLLFTAFLLTSCSSKQVFIIRGEYSDGSGKIRTDKTAKKDLEEDEDSEDSVVPIPLYFGPEYAIGVLSFQDKTKTGMAGLAENLAREFSETISATGLEPLFITEGADGGEGLDFRVFGEITRFEENFSKKGILQTKIGVNVVIEEVLTGDLLVKDEIVGVFKERKMAKLGEKKKLASFKKAREMAFSRVVQKVVSPFIEKLNKLPFKSKIIAISDGKIYFKGGEKSRLKVGERLKVYKNQKARLLIGEILLEGHEGEKISVASVALGGGIKEGDLIEKELPSPL